MNSFFNNKIRYTLLLIFLFANLPRLFADIYTLEWNFIELSNYFNNHNYFFNIERYKIWQANNVIYPLIISYIDIGFSQKIFIFLSRSINIILLTFCIYRLIKTDLIQDNLKDLIIFSLIFMPILNVYIFRIYPDVLSVSFFYLAIISQLEKKYFQFFIFFLFSVFIKPISIIFSPILFLLSINLNFPLNLKLILNKAVIINFFSISIVVILYIIYLIFFEKILFSNHVGSSYLKFDIYNSFNNFIRYFVYIFIISFPLLLRPLLTVYINIYKSYKYNIIIYSIASSLLILYLINLNSEYGELTFGYLSNYFQSFDFLITVFLIFNISILVFYSLLELEFNKSKYLLLFLISLICLSIFVYRPAQRYFLYFLPFFYFFIFFNFEISLFFKNKIYYFFIYILLCSLISFGQFYVQNQKTITNHNMVEYLKSNNLIEITNPGDISGSHGYIFENYLINVDDDYFNDDSSYYITVHDCDMKSVFSITNNILFNEYQICLKKY